MRSIHPRSYALSLLVSFWASFSLLLSLSGCSSKEKQHAEPLSSVESATGGSCLAASAETARELEAVAFSNRALCLGLVESERLYPKGDGHLRFASWNIRFFPDGGPRGPYRPTDIEWLACSIAFLQIDLLAVQEFLAPVRKNKERIGAANTELIGALNRFTGGDWALELDDCEPNRMDRQHVGLLYNRATLDVSTIRQIDSMNPDGGCRHLRPGLAATVKGKGGLDLHVVSFHAKAYADERSRARRQAVYDAFPEIIQEIRAGSDERDLLILGDFNTVGCRECPAEESPAEEIEALARIAESVGLRLVDAAPECTHYWDREKSFEAIDHILADAKMRELAGSVRRSGFCGGYDCEHHGGPSHAALSDHCPLLIDLLDEDLDP